MGSGDPSGLQNRRELALLALVSSTLTRFRQHCSFLRLTTLTQDFAESQTDRRGFEISFPRVDHFSSADGVAHLGKCRGIARRVGG
jgi:hypothetical protein